MYLERKMDIVASRQTVQECRMADNEKNTKKKKRSAGIEPATWGLWIMRAAARPKNKFVQSGRQSWSSSHDHQSMFI